MYNRLFVTTFRDMENLVKEIDKIKQDDLVWIMATLAEEDAARDLNLPDNNFQIVVYEEKGDEIESVYEIVEANAKNTKVFLIGERLRPLWEKYGEDIAYHCIKGCGFHHNFSVGKLADNFISYQKNTKSKKKKEDSDRDEDQLGILGSSIFTTMAMLNDTGQENAEKPKAEKVNAEKTDKQDRKHALENDSDKGNTGVKVREKRSAGIPVPGRRKKPTTGTPQRHKTEPSSVSGSKQKKKHDNDASGADKKSTPVLTRSVEREVKNTQQKNAQPENEKVEVQDICDVVATHEENTISLDVDLAKSIISSYMNTRLLRHVRFYCAEQYKWLEDIDNPQYDENANDLILMLLKARDEEDFNSSWGITHKMAPLFLTPQLYKLFKKEALHYKNTMAELYDRDNDFNEF